MKNKIISPSQYAKLMQCQPSSASVERSFSILNAILKKIEILKMQMLESMYALNKTVLWYKIYKIPSEKNIFKTSIKSNKGQIIVG